MRLLSGTGALFLQKLMLFQLISTNFKYIRTYYPVEAHPLPIQPVKAHAWYQGTYFNDFDIALPSFAEIKY